MTWKPDGRAPVVLFDFDYTLADSSSGVIECINYALENMGLPTAPAEQICRTIGLHLGTTLEVLTGETAPQRAAEFERLFMQRADCVMAERSVVFPTVAPTLHALKKRGARLGIVSTKTRRRIVEILRREGLDGFFELTIGGDDVPAHKPDPSGLLLAAARLGCAPAGVVYVGDSVTDAEAAQRGGMDFVAVLSGVTPKEAFAGYVPAAIIGELTELPAVLAG